MCQGLSINAEVYSEDLRSPPPYEELEKEGGGSKGKDNHNSEASRPPSPMQSISPSTLVRLDSFVPMGFNVDHDLRDFLKWKSECVDGTVEGDI
jgi:hypothetical protein